MSKFVPADRNQRYLLPPDLRDWIPEGDMVHFVIEASERVDLQHFRYNTRGTGSAQYHPQMMLALLIYCYANGIFSSRRIERATYRDIAVRYLTADTHPDHHTICKFRRENFHAIAEAFLQILLLAKQLKLFKVGNISIDGTKLKANASKRRSIRYDRAGELSEQLAEEIDELLSRAEQADGNDDDDDDLPKSLSDREKLKRKLDAAREELEARAKEQQKADWDEYERKVQAREARQGRRKGKKIQPPTDVPRDEVQINLTDPDSGLMRKNKNSEFQQSYNAQASVDADGSQLVLGCHVSDNASDSQELVKGVEQIPSELGVPKRVLADNGYANGEQVETLQDSKVTVLVAVGSEDRRRRHDFRPVPDEEQTGKPKKVRQPWIKKMKRSLSGKRHRRLYRLRKQTVEPVFGTIKSTLGFRQFVLRGMDKVTGEWQLVALAYNCKRMHNLVQAT